METQVPKRKTQREEYLERKKKKEEMKIARAKEMADAN